MPLYSHDLGPYKTLIPKSGHNSLKFSLFSYKENLLINQLPNTYIVIEILDIGFTPYTFPH
ncbi:hypothetical protein DXZ20_02070 [Leptolyngbyaceae cyanobacterium CCMR0081]|uniref:Uncharacterized protein n=1 Tax=Adonisia turfae CCMR0081 TaxID=2292702 RepID=A0A6M0RE19_9CYAN|nr:hypothetical protein [Adonisia turfae CCMR0081]